jgi:hypothetical protein
MQLVMSGFVVLAGLYLALFAGVSGDLRLLGWVLVALGVFGLVGALVMRNR